MKWPYHQFCLHLCIFFLTVKPAKSPYATKNCQASSQFLNLKPTWGILLSISAIAHTIWKTYSTSDIILYTFLFQSKLNNWITKRRRSHCMCLTEWKRNCWNADSLDHQLCKNIFNLEIIQTGIVFCHCSNWGTYAKMYANCKWKNNKQSNFLHVCIESLPL